MGRALALAARGFKQAFGRDGTRIAKYGVAVELRLQAGFTEHEIDGVVELTEKRRAAVRSAPE
jgi:hypothetical protein